MKTLALSVCAMTLVACSAPGNSTSGYNGDDNGGSSGNTSHPGADGGDPGKDGGGGPPPGTALVDGTPAPVAATTDGQLVYVDDQGTTLAVVDVASGKSTTLAKGIQPTDVILVVGKLVAFWTGVDKTTGIGAFHVYSAASGVKDGDAASMGGLFGASDDGSRLAYSSAATSASTTITTAAGDLSGPTAVAINVGFGTAQKRCSPIVGFAKQRLFAATCAGTATTATVRAVDASGTAVTILSSALPFLSTDAAGDKVLVISSAGAASVHSVPDNAATAIDTGVGFGVLSDDGQTVLYRAGTALKRSATTAPQPQTIVTTGVRGILTVSLDFAWAMAFSNAPDDKNAMTERYDIQLADGKNPGALSTLLAGATGIPVGFTQSHAVYMTDLPDQGLVGAMHAKPLGGGSDVQLASDGLFPQILGSSKVLFQAGFKQVDKNTLIGDVQVADLGADGKPVTIVAGADPGYVADAKNVYFTVGGKTLYWKAIP
jgi:hypothetical protein